jgi:MinD-like ATPase involved in chromosome partitioning or flagellar assembly
MTSPRERDERDFFDNLGAGPPSESDLLKPPEFADPNGVDTSAPEIASGATAAIRLADHLRSGDMRRSAQLQPSPAERGQAGEPSRIPVHDHGGQYPSSGHWPQKGGPAADRRNAPRESSSQPNPFWDPRQGPPSGPPLGGRHGASGSTESGGTAAGTQNCPPRPDGGWKVGPAHPPGRSVEEPRAADMLREQLRAADLIAARKVPSSRGWRKAIYLLSGKAINVGESLDERRVRDLKAGVDTNLRGTYTVAVLGGKGGAGKTAMTVAIGSVFARLRNDRVVAVDADPAQAANLAARVDSKAASVREINNDNNLMRYADVRALTGQNDVGLDVVASPRHAGSRVVLTANEFTNAHTRLQRFYSVLFVDCGVDLDHAVMAGVLGRADAVMMVASAVPDGAAGASTSFDWLRDGGYHQLLSRTVLVINHIRAARSGKDRKSAERLVDALIEHFGQWVPRQRIVEVPFDRHIASAGVVELDQLDSVTNRRILEGAAAVASGFSATTDLR